MSGMCRHSFGQKQWEGVWLGRFICGVWYTLRGWECKRWHGTLILKIKLSSILESEIF